MSLVARAAQFAKEAHASVGQLRKYTLEPYIVHPARVARMVKKYGGDPEMVAAAWLHDTVEDTPVTLGDIGREFGLEVRELVFYLTDISKPSDGNRIYRKGLDRAHIGSATGRAQTIKLADLIDNTKDIVAHDVEFAVTYLKEKRLILPVLLKGDKRLRKLAWEILDEAELKISQLR